MGVRGVLERLLDASRTTCAAVKLKQGSGPCATDETNVINWIGVLAH